MTTTAARTVQSVLNQGNPALVAEGLARLPIGDTLAALVTPEEEDLVSASAAVALAATPVHGTLKVDLNGVPLRQTLFSGAVGAGLFRLSGTTVTLPAGTVDATAVKVKYLALPYAAADLAANFAQG